MLSLGAIFLASALFSQPINDNCTNATDLILGTECVSEVYTSIAATAEAVSVAANPSCGAYQGGDVWFKFEVPASGNFRIEMSGNWWTLNAGSCGSFTELNCSSVPANYARPDLAGQIVYLRAFRFNSSAGNDFDLCVSEIDPPANDNCANAANLTLGTTCTLADYSNIEATTEDVSVAANPSCGAFKGGDVWFSFDVPLSGNFRVAVNGTWWTLNTGSCGSLVEIDCRSLPLNYSRPDLAGQTLYIRAFRFNNADGEDFALCVSEITPQPNDNCTNATVLSVGSECTLQDYSNTISSDEDISVAPNPTCGAYKGGDTWFTFQVPASGQFRIDLGDTYWVLYEGTCGSFTQLLCESTSLNFDDPTLAGETLYLRTFRFNSSEGEDFDLCIWEIEAAVNNNCANATQLSYSDTCLATAFSSQFASGEDTDTAPNPSCGAYKGGDVWFQFQAPPMGQFTLNRPMGTQNLAFYTGSCGSFTEILCTADSEIIFDDPILGGQTIFVRAFRFNNRDGSDFELCLLTNEVASNDNCTDAIDLAVGENCNFLYFDSYNATDEVGLASNPTCGQYQGDDVWFTFDVPADGNFGIRRLNVVGNFGYSLYTGTCGSFGAQICAGNPQQTSYNNPALAGQTIYIRVFNRNSTIGGVFGLCISEVDCNNTIGGTAYIDNCATCVGGTTGLSECVPDCDGVFGGTAFIDNCDNCVGGETGLEACVQDCNGDFGGTSFTDNCNFCVGGNTGLAACLPDCNGDFGGTAYFDTCGDCAGGNTGEAACCPTPFPALDEAGITTTLNPTNVVLGWNGIDGQLGCQVQLRFAGASSNLGSTIVGGSNADSFTLPGSALQLNQAYEWRVRCGCSQTPIIAGPFSSWQAFSTSADGVNITAAPNPMADHTTVTVDSDIQDHAVIAIFDLNGRQVAQLYSGEMQAEQSYRLTFDASNLPNGVYLCRYTGLSKTTITKIMVAR